MYSVCLGWLDLRGLWGRREGGGREGERKGEGGRNRRRESYNVNRNKWKEREREEEREGEGEEEGEGGKRGGTKNDVQSQRHMGTATLEK